MVENSLKGQKTLSEKEKLLVMSNFSFSHIVFKRLVLQTHKNNGLFGKGLRVQSDDQSVLSALELEKMPYLTLFTLYHL